MAEVLSMINLQAPVYGLPFKFNISNTLKQGENKIRIKIGNLIANKMWMKEDMGKLRTWGWRGIPDLNQCNAGLFGLCQIDLYKSY